MTEPATSKYKIHSLEGLRGLMAWWVVLGHISLSFNWRIPIIDRNILAVDVFILLSGFVISRLIDRKKDLFINYIIRRAFRLFPLYICVLILSTILLRVQLSAWQFIPFQTEANLNRFELTDQSLANLSPNFLAHLFLVQGMIPNRWLPGAAYSIVGQAWSISLEWQFYILAPFLFWTLAKRERWIIFAFVFITLMLTSRLFPGAFLGSKIAQFGAGICSYLALDRVDERRRWILATLAFAVVAIAQGGVWQLLPFSIWSAVLLSSAALPHNPTHKLAVFLSSKPLTHFGMISYSIYLVHMIPLYVSIYLLSMYKTSLLTIEIVALCSTVSGAYLLSLLTYFWIEKRGIALGSRLPTLRFPTHDIAT